MDAILFYVFAAIAVASAVVVIAQRNPMYSAFALVITLCSVAVIFGLLGSPFIAALQVIVYAGAIMVLFSMMILMLLTIISYAASKTANTEVKIAHNEYLYHNN